MNDELIVSLIRSVLWAGAFVSLGFIFGPILNHWIHRSLAIREQELRTRELQLKGAIRQQELRARQLRRRESRPDTRRHAATA